MAAVSIAFLGATESVTGSRFLISSHKSKILVDCGMFQGLKSERKKNYEPFPVDISTIDSIVLSHAHFDHSGFLPLLVKEGYRKEVICTPYTEKIVGIILRDSAHLQAEDEKNASEHPPKNGENTQALYDLEDVEQSLRLLKINPFHQRMQITEDGFVTFFRSGHILGSACVLIEVAGKNFLFTSDLGRDNHPLLTPPDDPSSLSVDAVITESTYGDRTHEDPPDAFLEELKAAIARGGSILIPAFAVDRTEVILIALRDLIEKGKIPRIPIFVDSPMAIAALNFYREAIAEGSFEIRDGVAEKWRNQDPFDTGALYQLQTSEESKSLKNVETTSIIISASGMSTGGRVVHHLKNMLPHSKNTVILVGFQTAGSRGRALEEGQPAVRIHGELIPVKAHIAKVESFSVHADSDELIAWLGKITKPTNCFVVHGEHEAQIALKLRLERELGWSADIPKTDQIFTIG
jgi:metallo-beta-lactamase family protein